MGSNESPSSQPTSSSGDFPSQADALPDTGADPGQQQASASAPTGQPMQSAEAGQSQQQGDGRVAEPQQIGEGSYEGTQDYKERIGAYLERADVEADAEAAAPRSAQEADEMKAAEQEALSHTKSPGQ